MEQKTKLSGRVAARNYLTRTRIGIAGTARRASSKFPAYTNTVSKRAGRMHVFGTCASYIRLRFIFAYQISTRISSPSSTPM
jgi:hypothetical protein